jgi:hypothetical protein
MTDVRPLKLDADHDIALSAIATLFESEPM